MTVETPLEQLFATSEAAPRVWPHMLRHSCGYYLADQGTDLRACFESS
jgi:site-specific recombinase XerD